MAGSPTLPSLSLQAINAAFLYTWKRRLDVVLPVERGKTLGCTVIGNLLGDHSMQLLALLLNVTLHGGQQRVTEQLDLEQLENKIRAKQSLIVERHLSAPEAHKKQVGWLSIFGRRKGQLKMSSAQLDAMMELSQARAEAYLRIAKTMVMNEFGPATEHTHTETAIGLATAMMQHEGAQIIAEAYRAVEG